MIHRFGTLVWLATRNLRREARRSLLVAAAMVAALGLLVVSRTVSDGSREQSLASALRVGIGHVAVQAPGHLESGMVTDRLGSDLVSAATDVLGSEAVAPMIEAFTIRLSTHAMASSATSAVSVRVEGVDPVAEARFSRFGKFATDGRYLEASDRLAAFVGRDLAERLGLRVGSRFVLTAQTAGGEIEGQLVRVRGVYRTGVPAIDGSVVHIPIEIAREWLAGPGEATTLAVLARETRWTPALTEALRARLPGDAHVVPWRESMPELEAARRMNIFGDSIFFGILFTIAALAILNAVLMSVLNRKREFGLLRALGLSGRSMGAVVFLEGLLLIGISGLVGTALGYAISWGLWRDGLAVSTAANGEAGVALIDPVIYPEYRLAQVVLSVTLIFVVGSLATAMPARQAARLDPADAMKIDA